MESDVPSGIDFQANVCGGLARIIRRRISVWLLESLRRQGKTDLELLLAYPTLNAEDLTNAWNDARSRREEMDRQIACVVSSQCNHRNHQ